MSYIDLVEHDKKIHVWERNRDGELTYYTDEVPYYLYMKDNSGKGTYFDIYGNAVKRVGFPNQYKLKEYTESRPDITFESDVRPVYKHIIDNYLNADVNAPYNISYFDIEVDFDLKEGKGYPSPKDAFGEINAFSIFDSYYDCYIMLIPKHLKNTVVLEDDREGKEVIIIWTNNEKDMIKKFSEYLDHVDVTTAWNGAAFDMPYIMERAILHFGLAKAKTMFTRNNIPASRRDFTNEYGEDVWEWRFPGRPHLDMMNLFKAFHPGEKKSFKLDSVCEEELGEGKIEFESNLGRLYREDPQKFFYYSLHDSRLMKFLDDKRKIISLGMVMIRDMCALPQDIFGSVNILNMSMIKFARKNGNMVLPNMPMIEKLPFDGAIVFDTITGRHPWIFTVDVSSMYPSCIMALGMSKENIVYQFMGEYEDYIKVMNQSEDLVGVLIESTGKREKIPAVEIYNQIIENGWTISAHGTVFDGTMGIIASYLAEAKKDRDKYKKLMKQAEYGSEDYKMYDLYQQVMKRKSNSLYGVLSQPTFRLADIRLAASTTTTGRMMAKQQAYVADKAIQEHMSE